MKNSHSTSVAGCEQLSCRSFIHSTLKPFKSVQDEDKMKRKSYRKQAGKQNQKKERLRQK